MTHLIVVLLRDSDLVTVMLVLLEAALGAGLSMHVLARPSSGRLQSALTVSVFGLVLAVTSWLAFLTALASAYPRLSLTVPIAWAVPAITMSLLSSVSAAMVHRAGRRSARNAMLSGSLLSSGFSCMLFTGMGGIVRPFSLSYDLSAILTTMVVGAALFGLAFRKNADSWHRRSWVTGVVLATLGISVLALCSLAAVLPFEAWIEVANEPDSLASSPIAIIVGAEALTVLAFSLSGSLVDNRVAARDRLEAGRLRQLADSTFEGILIHRDGAILDGNCSLKTLLGVDLTELRASRLTRFLLSDADRLGWDPDQRGQPIETEILSADGRRLPVELLSRRIIYAGRPALVTALRDVRERRISEERIRFLAHHDVLTGLPNRALLNDTLTTELCRSERLGAPLAVLCLDLDSFKIVNDTLGHAAGDELLCQVASRLRDSLRPGDFVARIGGDEFVVIQAGEDDPSQFTALANRLIASLAVSFDIGGQKVNIGSCVGIAAYPRDGESGPILLRKADVALYRGKKTGRGSVCVFEAGMDLALRKRRDLEQDLYAAWMRQEFFLHFQPIFDASRAVIAFEALLRWKHPKDGLISPTVFIPLAEECGLIVQLGEWVLRKACEAAVAWSSELHIAVNLSPAQFRHSDIRDMVASVLADTGLAPHRLELEITEGVLIDDIDGAKVVLNALRGLGTRLVLDDFGTGYSSLSYLQFFAFDKLKIDRSFVQRLGTDEGSRAIVSAIIAMSRSLGMAVTAEGVETEQQFRMLCLKGCDEMQGFLLGTPMDMDSIDGLLALQADGATTQSQLTGRRDRLRIASGHGDEALPLCLDTHAISGMSIPQASAASA